MAIIIDAQELVMSKKRLPTEAFFVDTNIVLDIVDPFGRSIDDPGLAKRNELLSDVMHRLKSFGYKSYSSVSVALEYYKYVQVGFYQTQVNSTKPGKDPIKFTASDFKRLRDTDLGFMTRWELQLKEFKKTFTKKYSLFDASPHVPDILSSFQGNNVDFGDHLLFKTVMQCEQGLRCVFSNDGDFYSFPDDLHVLTTNKKVIAAAKSDNKLLLSIN